MQHSSSTTPESSVIKRIVYVLLLIPLLTTVASAQTFRGTILGTITDPNDAVVAGATVTAKNTSTGLDHGWRRPAEYSVSAEVNVLRSSEANHPH